MLDVTSRIGMCATIKHLCGLHLSLIVDHIERWFVDREDDKDSPIIMHSHYMRLRHCVEWANAARCAYVNNIVNDQLRGMINQVNWELYDNACCRNCGAEVEDWPSIYAYQPATDDLLFEFDNYS